MVEYGYITEEEAQAVMAVWEITEGDGF